MFAWAHARFGDPATAHRLAEGATLRLETGDAAHRWISSAFSHRIAQAAKGDSPTGEWPADLLDALELVDANRVTTSLRYVVDQLRVRSRVLEPDLRTNPYAEWMRQGTPNALAIVELERTTDPADFAIRFQSLLDGTAGTPQLGDRLRLIETAAKCGRRAPPAVVAAIAREGLMVVELFLRDPPDLKYADELLRALVLAVCDLAVSRDHELLGRAVVSLANWIRYGNHMIGRPAGRALFDTLLPGLYRADMATDAALLLDLVSEVGEPVSPAGSGLSDLLARLQLAGCQRWLGLRDVSESVFGAARSCLFGVDAPKLKALELARLAEAYMQAIGRDPVAGYGRELLDLFDRLPRLPNGFTTATHYSRLHFALAETAILAVTTDDFRPARALRARLGADELAARRNLLPALRERVRAWAAPDW